MYNKHRRHVLSEIEHPTEQQRFIEDMGLFFERSGGTRMMGRVLAWLLIAQPPLQSAEELMAALQVSRGAISTTLRQCIERGMVDRISLPGQRRDYYQIRPGAGAQMMQRSVPIMTAARVLIERGLALLADQPPLARARLDEMHSLYEFLEERLPALIEEWDAQWRAQQEARR